MSHIADHWALLVEGYYKLMKSTVTSDEIASAHELFKEFVVKTEAIYSKEFMTFNLHQLLHLAQSVLNWGPLWSHSGYPFESNNAKYLKQIHSPKGVTLQVCRAVSMRQSEVVLRRHVASMDYSPITDFVNYLEYSGAKNTSKLRDERYFGRYTKLSRRKRTEMQLSQNARVYVKMVKNGCLYRSMNNRSVRSDDSYAQLDDGNYIRIVEFITDAGCDTSITVCKLLEVRRIINDEFPTAMITVEHRDDSYVDTKKINSICVAVEIDEIVYLTPPPNLYRN
ncbi:hypothetical protein QAD02_002275 [Eretmocerus hayati]|uniref:Uncharacterized protein n=1 Tax=Eretmocerus hayati TaxID=131215 RepID=A0ACC2NIU1_9HYME|nr:hypothetical protein QAD02_002275 [Eretmocerus hayati]